MDNSSSISKSHNESDYDEHINPLFKVNMCIILIHAGVNHSPSNLALNRWYFFKNQCKSNSAIAKCISEVEVVDNRVKQWLTNNSMGIVVDRIPCILVRRSGTKTIIYDIEHLDRIMNTLVIHV